MPVRWPPGRVRPACLVGLATAAYGVAITASPRLLAAPVGLTAPDGTVPAAVAELTRSTGTRDAALALALVPAPTSRSVGVLSAARGWALLEAATGRLATR